MIDVETLLAREFLRHDSGAERVLQRIHRDDDMYGYLASQRGIPPLRRRLQYFRSGREAVDVLRHALRLAGMEIERAPAVLEFGCGFGRVARFLVPLLPAERLWVSDVLPEAVAFLEQELRLHGFTSVSDPAQAGARGPFSAILVVSLFSHLPEATFHGWLERLGSWLVDGGVLLFSTHGAPEDGSAFRFVPESESAALAGHEYGSTWATPEWVGGAAREAGFRFHSHRVRELGGHQDLHLIAKSEPRGWNGWPPGSLLRGRIDRLQAGDGQFLVEGWAALPAARRPARGVELWWGERRIGAAELGVRRDDVAADYQDEALRDCGWRMHGALPPLAEETAALTVRADGPERAPRVVDVAAVHVDARGVPAILG